MHKYKEKHTTNNEFVSTNKKIIKKKTFKCVFIFERCALCLINQYLNCLTLLKKVCCISYTLSHYSLKFVMIFEWSL